MKCKNRKNNGIPLFDGAKQGFKTHETHMNVSLGETREKHSKSVSILCT
jgi:hypothetical protein